MARAVVLAPCAALWGATRDKCRGSCSALRCTRGREEQEEGPVTVEVATSVMSMLEGKKDPAANAGGLIDMFQRKREQQVAAVSLREELFASMDSMCIPRHDSLFPLLVAALAVLGDEPGEGQGAMDRFTGTSTLRAAAAADAGWLRPSVLFCDVGGEALNPLNSTRFERWLLFSMYIKFSLWWKGPSPASEAAQEFAYRMSNFVFDDGLEQRLLDSGFLPSRRIAIRYGRLFVGKLTSQQRAASVLAALQARLDEAGSGLQAFLLNTGDVGSELACLLTHRTSMAFLALPGKPAALWASSLLFGWSAAMGAAAAASSGLWEQCAIPVGLLAAAGSGTLLRYGMAVVYRVTHLVSPPLPLPAAQLGAFPGPAVYYRGALPSRACLFDLSAAAAVGSLTAAAAAILTADRLLMGCVSVPSSALSFSAILTGLLRWLSLGSSIAADGREELLQVSPLALGGVLGLSLALASLLPIGTSDGGRIVSALYGRQALRLMSKVTLPAVTASLLVSGKPLLALSWIAVHALLPDDSFQRDEVSQPGSIRAALGLLLTGAALVGFIPVVGHLTP